MKLKRMLAIVMTAGLSIFSLAGCSETTNNYANEYIYLQPEQKSTTR